MNIFSVVIGGIITIITAIFVENKRRPRLKLKMIEPMDFKDENRPDNHRKYLLIGVENKNLPSFVRLMSRNAALQCHGTISFHHLEDGQNIFGRAMDIRWSGAPQPIPIRIDYNGHHLDFFDYHRFLASQRIDIYPGDKGEIAAVVKFDNEQECWGWNNESYFCKNTWRNDKWKLDKGRYLIKVTVYSSGENVSKVFRLINDVSINDYRLMPATDEDKEKIRG